MKELGFDKSFTVDELIRALEHYPGDAEIYPERGYCETDQGGVQLDTFTSLDGNTHYVQLTACEPV